VYVLLVFALLPRIALPVRETRAVEFVAVRATTLRADCAVPRFVTVRDATLRDAALRGAPTVLVVIVARDATAGRPATVRDAVFSALFTVVRATVAPDVERDVAFARPDARTAPAPRGDCAVGAGDIVGAIGSANTARIDSNVEQTKKAPANKNIVPTAFLKISPKLRFFINYSLYPVTPGNLPLSRR